MIPQNDDLSKNNSAERIETRCPEWMYFTENHLKNSSLALNMLEMLGFHRMGDVSTDPAITLRYFNLGD